MSWQESNSRLPLSDDVLFLPASAKTVSQAEVDALEAKRIRRLRELGDWRPSSGWHIEPRLPPAAALEDALEDEASRLARPPQPSSTDSTVVLLRMSGARQSLHGN